MGQVWCMNYKEGQVLLESGTVCYMHYKEGQVLLQSGTGLIHALKRWTTVITKWDKFDACI